MLEIRNTVKEMKKAFDGDISRLDMAEERTSELEDTSIRTSQTEAQRGETEKKWSKIGKRCRTITRRKIKKERQEDKKCLNQ